MLANKANLLFLILQGILERAGSIRWSFRLKTKGGKAPFFHTVISFAKLLNANQHMGTIFRRVMNSFMTAPKPALVTRQARQGTGIYHARIMPRTLKALPSLWEELPWGHKGNSHLLLLQVYGRRSPRVSKEKLRKKSGGDEGLNPLSQGAFVWKRKQGAVEGRSTESRRYLRH